MTNPDQQERCPICGHEIDALHVELDSCPLDNPSVIDPHPDQQERQVKIEQVRQSLSDLSEQLKRNGDELLEEARKAPKGSKPWLAAKAYDAEQEVKRLREALREFEVAAENCDKAATKYESNSGTSDLWNHGAAAAWRLAASRLRAALEDK